MYPDLRRMSEATHGAFFAIVLGGSLRDKGMAGFADILDYRDVENIRDYLVDWAQRSRAGNPDPVPESFSGHPERGESGPVSPRL